MTEGELKKRIRNAQDMNIYAVDSCLEIVDELKKDLESKADFEVYSYSLTESEESIIIPLRIWNEWFGSNKEEVVDSDICNQCDDYSAFADKKKCLKSPYKDGLCHG